MLKITKIFNRVLDLFSKKLGMNIRHLFSLIISKFYDNKVNENLIAFGSTNGNAFTGNSKELFLYLNKNSNYHCVWFTSSDSILNDLRKKGYHAESNRKIIKPVKILKAAKYIFITHGFGDVLLVDFSPDTTVVHLDHGSALKLIGYGLKTSFLNVFQRKVHEYWNKRISYLTVCSEETKRIKKFSYDLPPERVVITGYPRNRVLEENLIEYQNNIRKKISIENSEEILLYAPTFRDYPIQSPLNDKFLKNLDDFLIRENKILLYKPHPFEDKISLKKYTNIRSIDPNVDIMDLLLIADVLITDYSGVFFDYLLTLKPILFYPYDLEKYTDARDFFYDYQSLVPGPIVRTEEQLISKLGAIQEWAQQYLEARIKARDKFNKYHDGKAIERIIQLLDLKIEKRIRPFAYPEFRIERPVGRFNRLFNTVLEFISRKVGMNIKHIISYPLSKLFSNKVYEDLLVFGSTNGQAFAGNPKIIFEYLCKHSNYQCVWITGSETIFRDLKKRHYNVVLNKNIIKTIKTLKAAKYIFISHGFGDIFYIDFSPSSRLIHLAHGISFKKGGHDLETTFMPFVEKMMNAKLVNHMNLLIDSSDETKRHKMSRFNLPSDRIAITGYPRNDILINHTKELDNHIKKKLGIKKDYDVILYAPTFRDYKYKPPLTEEFLEKLERFLLEKKKFFLYKPHPFTQNVDLSNYKNVISIERNVDILDLLIISDVLITDYSSVFYDYLLTMRPIIFFAEDLEKYTEVRDFYYDYESFIPGPLVRSGDELIQVLKNFDQWESKFREKRKLMRDQFNKYHDGRSTERIVELLELKTF
ncbi:MAG: CDP-glycerol glycerophosphotransferase family protein [Promethearchaeota archaeon]